VKFKNYVEAPNKTKAEHVVPWLFLAGGITGCYDWQAEALGYLLDKDNSSDGTIFNPRRSDFDITDVNAAEEQITWEFLHLANSDAILFWFAKETIQPIVLFELGRWSVSALNTPIFVGVHPEYPRRQDVEIQMKLAKPKLPIFYDLKETCDAVLNWRKNVF